MLDPKNLTPEQKKAISAGYLRDRQRCRTDLFYLCNAVLAPAHSKIMVPHAHTPITDHFQKFKGWEEVMDWKNLRIVSSQTLCSLWDLEGPRDSMLLVSRGHLKTTIDIGHIIQWIINYPDIRVLIATATGEQAERMVKEIRGHFQFNNHFRWLFPEFCPPAKKAADFGSATEFTVPNRLRKELKEPTVMTASIGKVIASTHHEVIKADDVVSEGNTRTKGQIQETKDFFGYMEPLRERGPSKEGRSNVGWKDVVGTIYDFGDYMQMIVDHEAKLEPEKRQWKITKQSCWVDKEKRIALWPERFPPAELDRILNSPEVGPYIFSSQYELNPVPPGTGLATPDQIKFFPAKIVKQMMPRYRIYTTIDLSTLDGTNVSGDYTAMVTAGFDSTGRLDVLSIQNGRFTDEQVVDLMFLIQQTYPQNVEFRIQKDQIAGGLRSFLRREMERRGKWLSVRYVSIPSNESKNHKIIRFLRSWFALGLIRFSDAISCKQELLNQIIRFPRGEHDDILDALADQMHDADGEPIGDAVPRGTVEVQPTVENQEFSPYGNFIEPETSNCYAEVTGV